MFGKRRRNVRAYRVPRYIYRLWVGIGEVRVIALVSVGRCVFRFDFSFYFYFGVCFVWVLQLVLAMFRQGLVRRARKSWEA